MHDRAVLAAVAWFLEREMNVNQQPSGLITKFYVDPAAHR
jgi:hypothetical protein